MRLAVIKMPNKCFASWASPNWTRPPQRRDKNRSCSDQPQNPPPYLLGVTGHNVKHALATRGLDLINDTVEVVHLAPTLEQRPAIDRNTTIFGRIVAVVAAERENISVEDQADDFGVFIDQRAARVAPDNVVGGREIHRHRQVQCRLGGDPTFRQGIRWRTRSTAEETTDCRVRLYQASLRIGEALHRAIAEPQGKGRIGIDAGPVDGETRPCDPLGRGSRWGIDLGLVLLTHRPQIGIN